MQTQVNTSGQKNPSQSLEEPGFDQMAKSLSTAIAEFDEYSGILSSITNSIRPAWGATTRYVRRHPVQIAIGATAIGVLTVLWLRPRTSAEWSNSADGLQY